MTMGRAPNARHGWRTALMGVLACGLAESAAAQAAPSALLAVRCDSVLRAARQDTVTGEVRAYLLYTGDGVLADSDRQLLLQEILLRLTLPQPLQLPVFSAGPVSLRMLRAERFPGDSVGPRSPVLYGIYEFRLNRGGPIDSARATVASLAPGLDSSVLSAIRSVGTSPLLVAIQQRMRPRSVALQLRIASGARDGRLRVVPLTIFSAPFPRLSLVDARPSETNLAAP